MSVINDADKNLELSPQRLRSDFTAGNKDFFRKNLRNLLGFLLESKSFKKRFRARCDLSVIFCQLAAHPDRESTRL